jgi:hypothetical protein
MNGIINLSITMQMVVTWKKQLLLLLLYALQLQLKVLAFSTYNFQLLRCWMQLVQFFIFNFFMSCKKQLALWKLSLWYFFPVKHHVCRTCLSYLEGSLLGSELRNWLSCPVILPFNIKPMQVQKYCLTNQLTMHTAVQSCRLSHSYTLPSLVWRCRKHLIDIILHIIK